MNIDVLVEKISEKLREHQTQQVSASNSTLLKMIQDLSKEVEKNTKITIETSQKHDTLVEKLRPMMEAFDDSEKYKFVWTRTGIKIKRVATWITVVGSALGLLWIGFKKFILFSKL